mmetsp:Transcript_70342/g.164812  ORF Transcript_70342/g.164812 Transcript_70342/m.164812 type:complete len:218 (+) Transcript_70342:229-882(+)
MCCCQLLLRFGHPSGQIIDSLLCLCQLCCALLQLRGRVGSLALCRLLQLLQARFLLFQGLPQRSDLVFRRRALSSSLAPQLLCLFQLFPRQLLRRCQSLALDLGCVEFVLNLPKIASDLGQLIHESFVWLLSGHLLLWMSCIASFNFHRRTLLIELDPFFHHKLDELFCHIIENKLQWLEEHHRMLLEVLENLLRFVADAALLVSVASQLSQIISTH